MKYALIDSQGKVENIVVYDGKEPYKPAEGLALVEVNDWLEIGQNKDDQARALVQPDPVADKLRRNESFKNDLSLKASYRIEKRDNPALKFSDYLDQLESEVIN